MKLIEQFLAWWRRTFRSQGLSSPSPDSILFRPIDKDDVRRELSLGRNAKMDGSNNWPLEDASDLSNTELRIHRHCEGQLREYERTFHRERNAYIQRRNAALGSLEVNPEELEEQWKVDDVTTSWKTKVGSIQTRADDLKNYGDQLRNFRAQHDLWGWLPDCKSIWRLVLTALVIFALELVATVFLLRETGGLPMVLVISFGYCSLNCVLPFVCGPFFRWKNYNRGHHIRRIAGWVALLLTMAVGLALNLLMGHYRSAGIELRAVDASAADLDGLEELSRLVDNVGVEALKAFYASPFGIVDTLSWLLAVVGLFIFVISFADGYKKDDIYPYYGKHYKKYREQLSSYESHSRDLIEELKSERDKEVKHIVARSKAMRRDRVKVMNLENEIDSLTNGYIQACKQLEVDYKELIREYRSINQEARTSPIPAYFDRKEILSIPEPVASDLSPPPDEGKVKERWTPILGQVGSGFKVESAVEWMLPD